MTKSGSLVTTVKEMKIRNLKNRLFSRMNWTILSDLEQKNVFEKIVEKWLSLEASNHCKASDIQKSQKKVPDFGFNHLFSRIGPFWVIWSKKNFSIFGSFKNFKNRTSPRKKYFLNQIFPEPEIFRNAS